jgi:ribosomal protein S18 acetylase RimI-like enzyme
LLVPLVFGVLPFTIAFAIFPGILGGRLLDAAVRDQPAQLWVASRNGRAIDFYRHYGFETDGFEYADPRIPDLVELRMVR